MVVIPQLARHPQVLSLQTGLVQAICDTTADVIFIAVNGCAVDMLVPCLNRPGDCFANVVAFEVPGPESEEWDAVEGQGLW